MAQSLESAIKAHAKAAESVGYWKYHGRRGDGNLEAAIAAERAAARAIRKAAKEMGK